jgi:hypothetical protein
MKPLLIFLFVSFCWLSNNAFGQGGNGHGHHHRRLHVRELHIPDKDVPKCVYDKFHLQHPTAQADKWFKKQDKFLVVFRETNQWKFEQFNNTPPPPACTAQLDQHATETPLTSAPQTVQSSVNTMRADNNPNSQFHRYFGSQVQCTFKLTNGNYEVNFILTSSQKVAVEFNGFDTFPTNIVQEIDFN